MSTERWKELLEAGPAFYRGDMEAVMSKVHRPTRMYLEVRAALRRLAHEKR